MNLFIDEPFSIKSNYKLCTDLVNYGMSLLLDPKQSITLLINKLQSKTKYMYCIFLKKTKFKRNIDMIESMSWA